ncbi:MAG: VRR-NUC domain-containing protein [Muribaculaceae bacterium]|nr:VRR-NUC domain-containing protein [Muribaculaceae bacterium]
MRNIESNTQIACVRWFKTQYPRLAKLLFAVPNGGARSAITGAILKAEGVTKGVSDLLMLVPSSKYHGLCIEMKTPRGRQSTSQKDWQKAVTSMGYKYIVCHSFDEFYKEINTYFTE